MTIFISNLKRLIKDKLNLLFLIIVPVFFTVIIMSSGSGEKRPVIGVCDLDKTKYSEIIIETLKESADIVDIGDSDIKKMLLDNKIVLGIVVEKGHTKDLLDGNNTSIKSYSIMESDVSIPIKISLDMLVSNAKTIAKSVSGDEDRFYEGLISYTDGYMKTELKEIENSSEKKSNTLGSLGFLVMSMIYLCSNSASLVLKDKNDKTFYRIFAAPIGIKSYMFQNMLSFVLVMIIQVISVFAIMRGFFKLDFGPSIFNMFILFVIFGITSISLGTAIAGVSKDIRQSGTISTFLATPMCMLGGCFWDKTFMPDILLRIANFVPTTWAMNAAEKLLYTDSIGDIGTEILVLLTFAIVFFIAGASKRADISL